MPWRQVLDGAWVGRASARRGVQGQVGHLRGIQGLAVAVHVALRVAIGGGRLDGRNRRDGTSRTNDTDGTEQDKSDKIALHWIKEGETF